MDQMWRHLELEINVEGRESIRAHGRLLPEHPHLKGHFDGFPLLPAVSQLDIVQRLTETLVDRPLQIIECSRAKFAAMLLPGRSFDIAVNLTLNESMGQWLMKDGSDIFSKGFFIYAIIPAKS